MENKFSKYSTGFRKSYNTQHSLLTLKRQPHKMVKYTQTICRLLLTNCLSVSDHFMGLAPKGLGIIESWKAQLSNGTKVGAIIINL